MKLEINKKIRKFIKIWNSNNIVLKKTKELEKKSKEKLRNTLRQIKNANRTYQN